MSTQAVKKIGRILAGLNRPDRELVLDFLQREYGGEQRQSLNLMELAAKNLARDFKKMIDHEAYYLSMTHDIDQILDQAAFEAQRAHEIGDIEGHEMVSKMREEAKMLDVMQARSKRELVDKHYERLELDAEHIDAQVKRRNEMNRAYDKECAKEARERRRKRREEYEDWQGAMAMAARDKWFREQLKKIQKMFAGDEGHGLALTALMFVGKMDKAWEYFDQRVPDRIKAEHPELLTQMMAFEIFCSRSDAQAFEDRPSYPTPFDRPRPSPFAHA